MNGPQSQTTEVEFKPGDLTVMPEQTISEIVKFSVTESALAELESKYANKKFEVQTTKGMNEAIDARAEIRDKRVGLKEDKEKKAKPILAAHRYLLAEWNRINGRLEAMEQPIDAQIKGEQDRKAAEKAARDEAEAKRKSAIQLRLVALRNLAIQGAGKTSGLVEISLGTAKELLIDESFQEFQVEAQEAKELVIDLLTSLLSETLAKEQEEAKIKAEREELERQKTIQAEKEREAERLRLEAEEEARQKRIAEEGRLEGIRLLQEAKLSEEREKIESDRKAEEKAMAYKRASEQRIIDSIQAIRDIPYHYDPATSSSESILIALRIVEKTIPTEKTFGEHLQDAVESVARAIKQLESLYTQALSRENREAQVKTELEEADRLRKEQERIEADNRRREEEIARKELEQKEKEEAAALYLKLRSENRRETPTIALQAILEICLDLEGHPEHKEARIIIGLIAEGTLYPIETVLEPEPVAESVSPPPKRRGRKPKK